MKVKVIDQHNKNLLMSYVAMLSRLWWAVTF